MPPYSKQAQIGAYGRAVYPKYYWGLHAREFQNVGIPHGDIGTVGNGLNVDRLSLNRGTYYVKFTQISGSAPTRRQKSTNSPVPIWFDSMPPHRRLTIAGLASRGPTPSRQR